MDFDPAGGVVGDVCLAALASAVVLYQAEVDVKGVFAWDWNEVMAMASEKRMDVVGAGRYLAWFVVLLFFLLQNR